MQPQLLPALFLLRLFEVQVGAVVRVLWLLPGQQVRDGQDLDAGYFLPLVQV